MFSQIYGNFENFQLFRHNWQAPISKFPQITVNHQKTAHVKILKISKGARFY